MFDLLKKKIGGFAEKILGNAGAKPESPARVEIEKNIPTSSPTAPTHEPTHAPAPHVTEKPIQREIEEEPVVPNPGPVHVTTEKPIVHPIEKKSPPVSMEPELPRIQQESTRELKANVGITQKLGSLLTGTITLNEGMVEQFLEEFDLSLLEADVEFSTATALIEELRTRLSNKKISSREDASQVILTEIKHAIEEIIHVEPLNLDAEIAKYHPAIVLILGPNGAGKTTTIAKLAHRYTKMGKKVVLASADTFRAGSIEQLNVHAQTIGVRMVKHQYGADPAAVAYDAVQAAKAEHADVVLIDSAGRQDTNKNLLEELKKIQRVVQPHVKLYVGESYTGQAILEQARAFDETIGIDGFVLTKLDTDAKGGGVISILHNLKKPIVFFGIGQGYEDLIPFSMDEFLDRIIPTPSKGK